MEKSKEAANPSLNITAKITECEEYLGVNYFICNFRMGYDDDGSSWNIRKRFSHFIELQRNLAIKYRDLPDLPATTWFKLKEKNEVEARKKQLNDYLQKLCRKEALSTDSDFHNFINLEENLHNKVQFNKEKLLTVFPEIKLGIRDFVVAEKQRIVMAVCSEEKLQTRILSYWDNITLPFFGSSGDSVVGSLVIFKIISKDPWHVEKMYVKNFKAQATCIHFDEETNALAIGMANGKIRVLEIPIDFNFVKEVKYEANEISAHSNQVNGVCMDAALGYVYSVGKDGKFCVSDRTSCELYWSKQFDKFELRSMYHDVNSKRVFIGDSGGMIHVFSVKKYPPRRLTSIKTSVTIGIKTITCSDDHTKLFAGTSDGAVICLNLGAYGKEKRDTKEYPYSLQGKTKCVSLQWDEENSGLLSGNESGNVAFWSPEANKCEYVFNAHLSKVTCMNWRKSDRRLITGSTDGKIKVWKLPKSWVNPNTEIAKKFLGPIIKASEEKKADV